MRTRRLHPRAWIMLPLLILAAGGCREQAGRSSVGRTADAPPRDIQAIDRALTATGTVANPQDGVAAAVVIDVSGSMDDRVVGPDGRRVRKIDVARRAAHDVVQQFAQYAQQHPEEPVKLGIFEFSRRDGQPDCRPVVPLAAPDPQGAEQALARLDPEGGTPIGAAMVTAKLALDASGLTRRHLVLLSDGENTDGYAPEDVAAAIAKRPEAERPSIYFVAFDIEARRFNAIRDAGALLLSASNARELTDTLDTLITGKILVER